MSVTAFQTGQRFRFPSDDSVWYFMGMDYDNGIPIVWYSSFDGDTFKSKTGIHLSELIAV